MPIKEYLASTSQQVNDQQYNGVDDLLQTTSYGQYDDDTGSSTTSYSYDTEGRLTQIRDGLKGDTKLAYDHFGNLIQVTDPNTGVTQYNYSALGDLTKQSSPDTGHSDYKYDVVGNLTKHTNANNQEIGYSYDSFNRTTSIDYPGTDLDVTLTYDEGQYGKGRLTSVTDGVGNSEYQYDDRGLLTQTNTHLFSAQLNTGLSYNTVGELTAITYPSGAKVTLNYDLSGRLSGMKRTDSGIVTDLVSDISWQGANMASYQQGNGNKTDMVYDTAGRLVEKQYAGNTQRLQNQLDNQGQIIQQTWTHSGSQETNQYQYNLRGELTQEALADWNYSYDPVGNRISQGKTDASPTNTYSYYDNSNRLHIINSNTVLLDAAGNILDDGIRQYQYNAMNRLAYISNTATGVQASYSHNYLGQRVIKSLSGSQTGETNYAYGQSGELLGEYETNGSLIREYIYLEEAGQTKSLIAIAQADGSLYYVHTDHLATPRLATDDSGTVIWRWESDALVQHYRTKT